MQPRVAVIDYGIGNLRSAEKALLRVGAIAHLTDDHDEIETADAVVLPGVGHFGACMRALHATGLAAVTRAAAESDRPFLGICVGMQMLFEGSDEAPGDPGLAVLPGRVVLLPDTVKRPQMQWNTLSVVDEHPSLHGMDGEWMYFVHSYAVLDSPAVLATCEYGAQVVAVAGRGNVVAPQFHPEKSGRAGLKFLESFVAQIPVPA